MNNVALNNARLRAVSSLINESDLYLGSMNVAASNNLL